jgi:hypothetical protein
MQLPELRGHVHRKWLKLLGESFGASSPAANYEAATSCPQRRD